MIEAVIDSGDPDEAPDTVLADCFLRYARQLVVDGRYKRACQALSSAMQLLDGHSAGPDDDNGDGDDDAADTRGADTCLAVCPLDEDDNADNGGGGTGVRR